MIRSSLFFSRLLSYVTILCAHVLSNHFIFYELALWAVFCRCLLAGLCYTLLVFAIRNDAKALALAWDWTNVGRTQSHCREQTTQQKKTFRPDWKSRPAFSTLYIDDGDDCDHNVNNTKYVEHGKYIWFRSRLSFHSIFVYLFIFLWWARWL